MVSFLPLKNQGFPPRVPYSERTLVRDVFKIGQNLCESSTHCIGGARIARYNRRANTTALPTYSRSCEKSEPRQLATHFLKACVVSTPTQPLRCCTIIPTNHYSRCLDLIITMKTVHHLEIIVVHVERYPFPLSEVGTKRRNSIPSPISKWPRAVEEVAQTSI